jgi:hypothetical protein
MVVATKAVMQKLICGCIERWVSSWRIYMAIVLAQKVTSAPSQPPLLSLQKQAQESPPSEPPASADSAAA